MDTRFKFYHIHTTGLGVDRVYRVAAEDHYSAQVLIKQRLPWYRRFFLKFSWKYDTDPVELSETGYLQKLKYMDIVQNIDDILSSVQYL
jgi:hypothetical protein